MHTGKMKRDEIMNFIKRYISFHKHAPTFREIGAGVGINHPSHVEYHLGLLKEAGKVDWKPGKPRTLRILQ